MSGRPGVSVSHFGICVSDEERSLRFYTEALGFEFDHTVDVTPPFDRLTELPGMENRCSFLLLGDRKIELLAFASPPVTGSGERRPMNRLGITHLSLIVEDLEDVCARIGRFGGQVLDHTRVSGPHGEMIFCTDPDGTRIELWEKLG